MAGKMGYSEEGVLIPPYKTKECIEDIPKRNAIKSTKVQERLRLLGYRINTVSFDFVILIHFCDILFQNPINENKKIIYHSNFITNTGRLFKVQNILKVMFNMLCLCMDVYHVNPHAFTVIRVI